MLLEISVDELLDIIIARNVIRLTAESDARRGIHPNTCFDPDWTLNFLDRAIAAVENRYLQYGGNQ